MTRKLKVSLDGTQLSYTFDERVVTVERLHSVLVGMMNTWFEATDCVGVIQQIENNNIRYIITATEEEYASSCMKYSLESILQ